MTQKEALDLATQGLKTIRRKATDEFYYQDEKSLQHKPAPDKWSAIQCFEHINLVSAYYIREIRKGIELAHPEPNAQQKIFKPGLIGGYMKRSMEPKDGEIKGKMKTFTSVKPLADREDGAIVVGSKVFADFVADLEEFERLIEKSRAFDIQRIKITSLIGKMVRFKLGDCFLFLNAHTDRHLLQAIQAMGSGYDVK